MALLADEVVVIEIVDNLYVDPNHFRGTEARSGWSSRVKSLLRGAASCTHLMEMLIPMATTTLQGIRGLERERKVLVDATTIQVKVDSCYAYASHRDVVRMFWPQHYRPQNS